MAGISKMIRKITKVAKKKATAPQAAAGGGGKKPPLSPDKARKDLAAIGKKGQDMMTSLAAKKRGLVKLQKDKAAPDAIERAKAAIADMESKLGPILKGKVKAGKAKPIPKKQTKKPAKTPRQKAPAEKRPPINAGLIAAARAAKTPTFTYRGKKYSKSVILKGAK
jgi:hypothetical protein